MAEKFKPQTFDINAINKGDKFTLSDGISPEAVNAPIEAAAYVQALATNEPNNSEAGLVGVPNVSIEQAEDGTPRFKFSNLKSTDYSEKIKQIENQTNNNSQQIHNLTASLLQNETLIMAEVEQAFTSRETADGENIVDGQYTAPTKIQGDTVACKNLIPFPYDTQSTTINGITFTVNNDGSITIDGTATANARFNLRTKKLEVPYGKYTLTGVSSNINASGIGIVLAYELSGTYIGDYGAGVTYNVDKPINIIYVTVYAGYTFNNITIYPMLNEGTEALPYQPYFTGLKNAYFKGIKSTGKNLFDISKIPNVDGLVNNGDGTLTITNLAFTGMSLRDLCPILKVGDIIAFSIVGAEPYGISVGTYIWLNGESKTITEDMLNGEIVFPFAANISNIQIEYGENATTYEPYKEDIYELPEAVELGLGKYVDIANKKIVDNSVTFVLNGASGNFFTNYYGYVGFHGVSFGNILSEKENRTVNGVCTDATVTKNVGTNSKVSDMWLGVNDRGIYWLGILDKLGFTSTWADVSNPTTDEKKQAVSDFNIYLAERYASGNPVTIRYVPSSKTIATETPIETPDRYQAWKNGSETIVQGDTDNSEYGAMPTVTTEYFKLTEL